jgi:hypothetical protein
MISGQEPERPSAAMRSSSAFFSTRARKLQNVAADGLVELVEDRAGREQVLGGAEGLLQPPLPLLRPSHASSTTSSQCNRPRWSPATR